MTHPNIRRLAAVRPLILASRSPRRVMLLRELGVAFDQHIPEIPEERHPSEPPFSYAERLARQKAQTVLEQVAPNAVVIGCDTIVVLGSRVLEKPRDRAHALALLQSLCGKRHTVCSAVALLTRSGILESGYALTDVYFNHATDEQLLAYIDTGEPLDKAGAYGIQGMGGFLVDRIEGDLDTVIGLPRTLLDELAGRVLSAIEE